MTKSDRFFDRPVFGARVWKLFCPWFGQSYRNCPWSWTENLFRSGSVLLLGYLKYDWKRRHNNNWFSRRNSFGLKSDLFDSLLSDWSHSVVTSNGLINFKLRLSNSLIGNCTTNTVLWHFNFIWQGYCAEIRWVQMLKWPPGSLEYSKSFFLTNRNFFAICFNGSFGGSDSGIF